MRIKHTQAASVILLVVGLLSLAALACNSDQEWIIPRTETPTPTRTPVPMDTSAALYQMGDALRIRQTGDFFIYQTTEPEPDASHNRVMGSSCFPGTAVTPLDIAVDDDGNFYYRVRCTLEGWVPETMLEPAE